MASLVLFVGAALMRLSSDNDNDDDWQSDDHQTSTKGEYNSNYSCTYNHNREAILISPDDYVWGINQSQLDHFHIYTWKNV